MNQFQLPAERLADQFDFNVIRLPDSRRVDTRGDAVDVSPVPVDRAFVVQIDQTVIRPRPRRDRAADDDRLVDRSRSQRRAAFEQDVPVDALPVVLKDGEARHGRRPVSDRAGGLVSGRSWVDAPSGPDYNT